MWQTSSIALSVRQHDRKRNDFVIHALEITPSAQSYKDSEKRALRSSRAAVTAAAATTPHLDIRTCNMYNNVGHIAHVCLSKAKNVRHKETPRWALAGLIAVCLTEED
uniref:Uncharacterized protein n=2 Tax=Peronospora matthiolae TaxID=2874970 RepID=A0AAV1U3S1_9STRA